MHIILKFIAVVAILVGLSGAVVVPQRDAVPPQVTIRTQMAAVLERLLAGMASANTTIIESALQPSAATGRVCSSACESFRTSASLSSGIVKAEDGGFRVASFDGETFLFVDASRALTLSFDVASVTDGATNGSIRTFFLYAEAPKDASNITFFSKVDLYAPPVAPQANASKMQDAFVAWWNNYPDGTASKMGAALTSDFTALVGISSSEKLPFLKFKKWEFELYLIGVSALMKSFSYKLLRVSATGNVLSVSFSRAFVSKKGGEEDNAGTAILILDFDETYKFTALSGMEEVFTRGDSASERRNGLLSRFGATPSTGGNPQIGAGQIEAAWFSRSAQVWEAAFAPTVTMLMIVDDVIQQLDGVNKSEAAANLAIYQGMMTVDTLACSFEYFNNVGFGVCVRAGTNTVNNGTGVLQTPFIRFGVNSNDEVAEIAIIINRDPSVQAKKQLQLLEGYFGFVENKDYAAIVSAIADNFTLTVEESGAAKSVVVNRTAYLDGVKTFLSDGVSFSWRILDWQAGPADGINALVGWTSVRTSKVSSGFSTMHVRFAGSQIMAIMETRRADESTKSG